MAGKFANEARWLPGDAEYTFDGMPPMDGAAILAGHNAYNFHRNAHESHDVDAGTGVHTCGVLGNAHVPVYVAEPRAACVKMAPGPMIDTYVRLARVARTLQFEPEYASSEEIVAHARKTLSLVVDAPKSYNAIVGAPDHFSINCGYIRHGSVNTALGRAAVFVHEHGLGDDVWRAVCDVLVEAGKAHLISEAMTLVLEPHGPAVDVIEERATGLATVAMLLFTTRVILRDGMPVPMHGQCVGAGVFLTHDGERERVAVRRLVSVPGTLAWLTKESARACCYAFDTTPIFGFSRDGTARAPLELRPGRLALLNMLPRTHAPDLIDEDIEDTLGHMTILVHGTP